MSEALTDVSVASLFSEGENAGRFTFGKSKLYEMFNLLGIERFKKEGDRAAFITLDDLQRLDEYIAIANTQGKQAAAEFARKGADDSALLTKPQPTAIDSGVPEYSDAPMSSFSAAIALVDEMIRRELLMPHFDALAPQRQLKEAAEEGWVLSTAQVREILGLKSWSGSDRYGFRFERAGNVGSSAGWKVKQ